MRSRYLARYSRWGWPVARVGRYFLPDQPLHVIQRGNNRDAIFFGQGDYARYREWLAAAAAEYGCAIHGYVLMTNHVHLLVTPRAGDSLPRTMQSLGRRYVRHVNTIYRRTGTLWEGRYRAAPIDSEAYFLACCRYIELNPVRARIVRHPRDYRWSSYLAHAQGAADPLQTGHGDEFFLATTPHIQVAVDRRERDPAAPTSIRTGSGSADGIFPAKPLEAGKITIAGDERGTVAHRQGRQMGIRGQISGRSGLRQQQA